MFLVGSKKCFYETYRFTYPHRIFMYRIDILISCVLLQATGDSPCGLFLSRSPFYPSSPWEARKEASQCLNTIIYAAERWDSKYATPSMLTNTSNARRRESTILANFPADEASNLARCGKSVPSLSTETVSPASRRKKRR